VQPLRSGLLQRLTGRDGDDARPVHRDVRYARPVGGESVERPRVGRPLAEHRVALVQKHLRDKVQSLLGPGGDEDVLLPRGRSLRAHDLHDNVLYGLEAGRGAVLEGLGGVLGDVARDLTESFLAKGPGVGEPARQRDDAGA
jgi:hypothetical protein